MSFIQLKNIDVAYDGKKKILNNLCLDIEEGKLISLLGPSGCGKTTTLRVIAGFIEPNGGSFLLNGKDFTKVPHPQAEFRHRVPKLCPVPPSDGRGKRGVRPEDAKNAPAGDRP